LATNITYRGTRDWDGKIPEDYYAIIVPTEDEPVPMTDSKSGKPLDRFSVKIRQQRAITGKECTPHQARIQIPLAIKLKEFCRLQGGGDVTCEDERVDIKFVAPDKTVSFIEIKPAETAKKSIRLAIGQLLEYRYYPNANKADRLIIVGNVKEEPDDLEYLAHLKKLPSLEFSYVHWPEGEKSVPDEKFAVFVGK
jgi:hypothetical protein